MFCYLAGSLIVKITLEVIPYFLHLSENPLGLMIICSNNFVLFYEVLRKQIRLVTHIPKVTDDESSAKVFLDQFRKKPSISSF